MLEGTWRLALKASLAAYIDDWLQAQIDVDGWELYGYHSPAKAQRMAEAAWAVLEASAEDQDVAAEAEGGDDE